MVKKIKTLFANIALLYLPLAAVFVVGSWFGNTLQSDAEGLGYLLLILLPINTLILLVAIYLYSFVKPIILEWPRVLGVSIVNTFILLGLMLFIENFSNKYLILYFVVMVIFIAIFGQMKTFLQSSSRSK